MLSSRYFKSSKKAQSSLEVVAIISFMFLAMTVFLLVVSEKLADESERVYDDLITDLGDVIDSELQLASSVADGYVRDFYVQPILRGRHYEGIIYETAETGSAYANLVLRYVDAPENEYVTLLPKNVVGEFKTHENHVIKSDGFVFLNCGDEAFDFEESVCYNIETNNDPYACDTYWDTNPGPEDWQCNPCCQRYGYCC